MRTQKNQSRFIEKFGNHMQKQLSDIATSWDKGQPFKKDSIIDNGARPCIHYGELYKYGPVIDRVVSFPDELSLKKSNNGDILFPASDVTPYGLARCSALMTNGVLLGGDIIVLCISNDNSPEYVSYAINMQQDQLIRRVTGSVVRHMSAKSLKTVEIPIPSLDAQHQFVSLLRQADKSKFNGFKSRFIAWCSEWKSHTTIRDLVDTSVDKTSRKFKPEDIIRYIDISSVDGESNSVIGTTEYRFSEAPSRAQQCTRKGDILVSTVRPNLKNIAVNQLDEDNLVASSGFCVLRPKEQYSGLILSYVLSEPFTQKMVAEAKGSNYPAIHDSDILDYPITVPESYELVRVGKFVQQADKSKYLS